MKIVTAAIIKEGNKVLLARRAPEEKLEGYWEFPNCRYKYSIEYSHHQKDLLVQLRNLPDSCFHCRKLNQILFQIHLLKLMFQLCYSEMPIVVQKLLFRSQLPGKFAGTK